MSSPTEILISGVRPPVAGEVYTRDIPASVEVSAIPAAWQGQGVEWKTSGGPCEVLFGTSVSMVLATAARAARAANVLTADATSGDTYGDGERGFAEIRQSLNLTHFAIIGASGGSIRFRLATYSVATL